MNNPFLQPYNTPFDAVPFDKIQLAHYKPAFEEGMKQGRAEISEIKKSTPSFANTIEKLERAGELLSKVSSVFFNLNSSETSDEMQQLAQELSPLLTAYSSEISLDEDLFKAVKSVFENEDRSMLNEEQVYLLDKTYKGFVRSGANLNKADKDELKEISTKLSQLTLTFSENVMKDSQEFLLFITDENELAGLPEGTKEAAQLLAKSKGKENQWLITLDYPSYIPFMKYADNRELRKQLNEALRKQGIDGFTQLSANEIGIINFKFNGQVVENFNEKIEAALESVGLEGAKADIQHNIRYNTQYLTNNWQENPDGNQYLKGRLESKSLQQRLIRIRSKVDAIFDRYRSGDYDTGVDGAFPTTGQGGPRLRREPSPLPPDQQLELEEALDNLPPTPPPPPGGPDPDGNFSLREMSFFQTKMEEFNITVANRFGRLWTIEENLIDQFGEREVLQRLAALGIDPNSRDWRVTTQTDIFSGRIKDLLRDIREDYFEPLVEFLQSKGINEKEYNQFIYNLHAPERNAYLPTKFAEDLKKAESELAELEKSRLSTKQTLANARRKVTTLKNKIKKAEKGSGISTAQAVATLKKYGVIFDLKTMEARGSLTKGKNLLEAFNRYHKPMMDFTRKIMIDSGLETEQAVQDWDARYKYYVPLQGFSEETLIDPKTGREIKRKQTKSGLINSQMAVAGSLVKEAKGRESLAAAPLQQSVVQASSAAIQAEKNRVIQSLADLARAFPSKMYSVSEDVGDLVVDAKWDETKGYSRVGFRENGEQKYVEIYDELLAKGFDNFDTSITGNFMKLMRFGTRWLSILWFKRYPTTCLQSFHV